MIVPEKLILITSDLYNDTRADALESYINGNIYGYHIIKVQESMLNNFTKKYKNKVVKYSIKHGVNILPFFDKTLSLKVKRGLKKQKKTSKSVGKYKRINNLVNRYKAKAIFCMNTTSLLSCIRAKEKFGFDAKIVAYLSSFTLDCNTTLLGADIYIVENNQLKDSLHQKGIDKNNIIVKKFPVLSTAFFDDSIISCKAMFDLDVKKTSILLNAGCLGNKKIVEVLKLLIEVKDKFDLIVYLGDNEKLYNKLVNIKEKQHLTNVRLFTTINNLEKLFYASDIIVTVYDQYAIYLATLYSKNLIVFNAERDVERNDFEYLQKNDNVIYSKDSLDVVSKIFRLIDTEKVVNNEKIEELKSSTMSSTNCLIDLIGKSKED